MTPALSVVVVNWNAGDALRRAVDSVLADDARAEVLVVDNGSVDGSLDGVRGARIIRLGRNVGFAGGCNAGLDAAAGRHVLLLNPDATLLPGALAAILAALDREPDVGALGGRIADGEGGFEASIGRFPGPRRLLGDWIRRLLGRPVGPDPAAPSAPVDVDWLSGACLALSRSALARGVRFDPGYPLYVEDVDLCRAVWAAGLRVRFVPETWATHARGGTPAGRVRRRLRRLGESRYLRKWGGLAGRPLALVYALLARAWEPDAGRLPEVPERGGGARGG